MKRGICALSMALAGCSSGGQHGSGGGDGGAGGAEPEPVTISMSFGREHGLYDAPFPSDDLRRTDGTIDVSLLPNPSNVDLIGQAIDLLGRDARGFALAGAVFFRASGPLDPASLPDLHASVEEGASVFLVGVDPSQPDFLVRTPIDVLFSADGGPYGDENLVAALPLQGVPLRPSARYAAVVTRSAHAKGGDAIAQAAEVASLAKGQAPDGLSDPVAAEYADAIAALAPLVKADDIAALAVFTTDDPAAQVGTVLADARASHPISQPLSPPILTDTFPDYCVYTTTVDVPDYQSGAPPYDYEGGDWLFDDQGEPIFDHTETANVYFTIPRTAQPAGGFPSVVFVRTGGGGDRPLVDRGPCSDPTYTTADEPGTGPALHFAKVGFAGVQVDGPLGGIRNPTGDPGREDWLMFNIQNASALRDNVRESGMELALFAATLPAIEFDVSDCPGADPTARFDAGHMAVMGHSMGSWVAPLGLAWEPAYGAAVFSGAGASYISNVMDKLELSSVRALAEIALGYNTMGRSLDPHDPVLTMLQWAAEPSDPQVYDRFIVSEPREGEAPRHLLMLQGIVDHYILPSIANATSLALGLDEAGPAYDAGNAEEEELGQTPLGDLLSLAGRSAISLPASDNAQSAAGAKATAVVVQHPGDGIQDGHEVVFQTDPPKHQYRCFLAGWASGQPSVPSDDAADASCP